MRTKRIYEDREIWKEYALLSRNGICREYALFGIVLTQIWLRQMRFDSDFTQISGQKKADWGLWLELLDLLIKCPSLSPPLFVCFSILIPLALWSSQFWGDQRAGPALWSPQNPLVPLPWQPRHLIYRTGRRGWPPNRKFLCLGLLNTIIPYTLL